MSNILTERVCRPIDEDCELDVPMSEFVEMLRKAEVEAIKDGIRANSVIVNTNMVTIIKKRDAIRYRSQAGSLMR